MTPEKLLKADLLVEIFTLLQNRLFVNNAGLFEYKYECINEFEAKEIANNLHYGHNYVCDVDGNQITIKW